AGRVRGRRPPPVRRQNDPADRDASGGRVVTARRIATPSGRRRAAILVATTEQEDRMARVRYVGPDGGRNLDVARETGGSARMVPGRDYEVSDELASRPVASSRLWVDSPPLSRPRPVTPPITSDDKEG